MSALVQIPLRTSEYFVVMVRAPMRPTAHRLLVRASGLALGSAWPFCGELVGRAVRPLSHAIELENAFEVREQHLDLLAKPTRSAASPDLAIWRAMPRAPS